MRGHCILSHGFESGPDATKVTALAEAAANAGWSHSRPDYTDLDACREAGELGDVRGRRERLLRLARDAATHGPVVLAGSSLGAYISGLVSMQVQAAGLFLMAPPIRLHQDHPLDAARIPTSIIHGWHDELIPAAHVVEWAAPRSATLLLVDDSHRLSASVQASAEAFSRLLALLQGAPLR